MAEVDLIIGILIFFVVICLLLTIFALLYVSGIFHQVQVGTGKPPIGQVIIAYKFAKGPYKESGHLFTELCSRLKPEQKCLGIYYDDPKVVSVISESVTALNTVCAKLHTVFSHVLPSFINSKHCPSHKDLKLVGMYDYLGKTRNLHP